MGLLVGSIAKLTGNVTTLIWIGPRPARDIEMRLGYGAGRLAKGYWVAVLKEQLFPQDFEFDGTTLRSGGKLGLPASTEAADSLRPRVHDQIMAQQGSNQYTQMQRAALASVKLQGANRIAKVIPAEFHNPTLAPDVQYPMGGGGLQWKILRPGKNFLIATHVDALGIATTPSFSADIGPRAPYENREKVMRYLQSA